MNLQNQLPTFKRNYIWSSIDHFEVGPRREITLFVKLWRNDILNRNEHKWRENRKPATIASVRFGGVENLEEVRAFFEKLEAEITEHCGIQLIYKFDYDEKEAKIGEIYFRVYFENSGAFIIIQCQNITEKDAFSEDQ